MKQLFENEYMRINTLNNNRILEIKSRKVIDDIQELDRHITIINQYVKDTHVEKIILSLNNLDQISKESLLSEKFLPFISEYGVKNIAVITGTDKKVQTLLSELKSYLSPLSEQLNITSETFETFEQALEWIVNE